jgi:hypothetical protein
VAITLRLTLFQSPALPKLAWSLGQGRPRISSRAKFLMRAGQPTNSAEHVPDNSRRSEKENADYFADKASKKELFLD